MLLSWTARLGTARGMLRTAAAWGGQGASRGCVTHRSAAAAAATCCCCCCFPRSSHHCPLCCFPWQACLVGRPPRCAASHWAPKQASCRWAATCRRAQRQPGSRCALLYAAQEECSVRLYVCLCCLECGRCTRHVPWPAACGCCANSVAMTAALRPPPSTPPQAFFGWVFVRMVAGSGFWSWVYRQMVKQVGRAGDCLPRFHHCACQAVLHAALRL